MGIPMTVPYVRLWFREQACKAVVLVEVRINSTKMFKALQTQLEAEFARNCDL